MLLLHEGSYEPSKEEVEEKILLLHRRCYEPSKESEKVTFLI